MNAKEKLEQLLSVVEEITDFNILAEMKASLNSVYGESNNQIIKPNAGNILSDWIHTGHLNYHLDILSDLEEQKEEEKLKKFINDTFRYEAIIYFPEIIIKNDRIIHTIKDLYVKFYIRPDGRVFSNLYGMRTSLTEAEFLSKYVHSHLPGLEYKKIKFVRFCLGVGEINQVLALLNVKYSTANFMMFLMHIKNFLEWESKEGNPYMFIENIFKRDNTPNRISCLSDSVMSIVQNNLITKIKTLSIDYIMKIFNFSMTDKSITVEPTLEVEKWMANEILSWDITLLFGTRYTNNVNVFLSCRDNNGNYYELPKTLTKVKYDNGTILNFKGQDLKLQITNKQDEKETEILTNPKITEAVCEKLSYLFSKTALTSPGIKSGSALIYNTNSPESDHILVQQNMDGRMVGNALLSD